MKPPTFFVPILSDTLIVLPPEEHHHAQNVLRVQPGDTCFVVNGAGGKVQGCMLKTGDIEVLKRIQMQRPFGELSWMVPLLAPEELKEIVQAATTLGIRQVYLVQTTLTQHTRRDIPKILDKLRKVVVSAQKVASIPFQPKLQQISLEEMRRYDQGPIWVFHQEAQQKRPTWKDIPLLCFGPEGGFTSEEVKLFESHGALILSLGPINYSATLAPVMATLMCKSSVPAAS